MKTENLGKTLIADKDKVLMCTCHNKILGTVVHLKKIVKNNILTDDDIHNYIEIDKPQREHLD